MRRVDSLCTLYWLSCSSRDTSARSSSFCWPKPGARQDKQSLNCAQRRSVIMKLMMTLSFAVVQTLLLLESALEKRKQHASEGQRKNPSLTCVLGFEEGQLRCERRDLVVEAGDIGFQVRNVLQLAHARALC